MPANLAQLSPVLEQPIGPDSEASSAQPRQVPAPLLAVRRHPLAAVIAFVICMSAGGFAMRGLFSPQFRAESVVYVSPQFPTELGGFDHEHDRQFDGYVEQQVAAVTRAETLKTALKQDGSFWMLPGEDENSAVARLQKLLKVSQMGHSYQISIALDSSKKQGLAEFVNTVTNAYLDSAHRDELYGNQQRIATLMATRTDLAQTIDADLAEEGRLLNALGIVELDPTKSTNPFDDELGKLRDQLAIAHEKRADADARLLALEDKSASGSSYALQAVADSQVASDPAVTTMQQQLNTRRAQLLLQMNGLQQANPLYKQDQAEVSSIDRELTDFTTGASGKVVSQLDSKYRADSNEAARLESNLDSDFKKTRALADAAVPKMQRARWLSAQIDRLQANFANVDNRIASLSLESNSPGSEHVVSWASPILMPAIKRLAGGVVGVFAFSLFAALATAVLLQMLDPTISTSDDVERIMGFTPIGMLLSERDFPSKMRAEYLHRIAAGMDHAHRRTGARSFVFTSAGNGESRDLVRQLGNELCADGLRTLVVLVDNRSQATVTSDNPEVPRTSALAKQAFEQDADLILRAEGPQPDSQSLLQVVNRHSRQITPLLRHIRSEYDMILIGADPLLTSAATEHLVRVADGTVLISECGKTTKRQMERVAQRLGRMKVPGIAVVLSQIQKRRADRDLLENISEYARA